MTGTDRTLTLPGPPATSPSLPPVNGRVEQPRSAWQALIRPPGRFLSSTRRLASLAAAHPERLTGRLRDDVIAASMRAEAYQLFTLSQVSDMLAGKAPGAESRPIRPPWRSTRRWQIARPRP